MSQNAEMLSPEERFLLDEVALYVYQSRFGQNVVAMVSERAKAIPDERVIEKLLKESDEIAFEEQKIYSDDMQYKKDYIKKYGKKDD